MKKLLLLFTAVIGFQVAAQAQGIRYGLTAGLQSSHQRFSGNGLSIATSGLFGIHLGGVAEYAISDAIVIRPQLGLSLKGGRLLDDGDVYKTNLTYIDLPVHAVYKYEAGPGKILGGIGPYFSLFAGGKDDGDKLKVGTNIKGFDMGLSLMAGYELTDKNLSINLFYSPGLLNLVPSKYNTRGKYTNSTIGISVAYFLGEK
jgi:Outer membrane protein beta-barrel domain